MEEGNRVKSRHKPPSTKKRKTSRKGLEKKDDKDQFDALKQHIALMRKGAKLMEKEKFEAELAATQKLAAELPAWNVERFVSALSAT